MKKTILTVFAAAALAACSTPDIPVSDQNAISFGRVGTRAISSASEISEFKVWSCVAATADGAAVPLLEEERVYRTDDGWDYENTRYWVDNSHFYFLGLCAVNGDGSLNEDVKFVQGTLPEGEANYVTYTLNVQTPPTADLDVLAAYNYTPTTDNFYSRTVNMNFSHLMTKVNLKVKQDYDKDDVNDYSVKKVTISGVKDQITYKFIPFAAIENGYIVERETGNTTIALVKEFTDPVLLRELGSGALQIWGDDGLLLIPQNIAANTVRIRIDYIFHFANSTEEPKEAYVEGILPSINWLAGNTVTYLMSISEKHDITFSTPTVDRWGSPQPSGTIIIK